MAQDFYWARKAMADELLACDNVPDRHYEFLDKCAKYPNSITNPQYNYLRDLFNLYILVPAGAKYYIREAARPRRF